MKIIKIIGVLFISALLLGGCASSNIREGQASTVKRGTVLSMMPLKLSGRSTGTGAAIGSVIGTVAGANQRRSFKGMLIGAFVGQVVGVVGGKALEDKIVESDGFNVAIKTDGGDEIAVAQKADDISARGIVVGSRVKVFGALATATVERE